jgi:hypothetical protein
MSFSSAAHSLSGAQIAGGNGALLHFKFLGDFSRRVNEELIRKAYFNDGGEYKQYYRRLRTRRKINFMSKISVRFSGTHQLLDLELIKEPREPLDDI